MSQQHSATVITLTIAGSNPSGGTGIQADMKTMSAPGPYAMSVITALTVQLTRGVAGVHAVPIEFVRLQMDALLEDIVPDATKIGMLATAELAGAVGEYLPGLTHTVLDPVMVATPGDRLLDEQVVSAVCRLCTKADLITPNLYEVAVPLGEKPVAALGEPRNQTQRLRDLGARRAPVKGGHLSGDAGDVVDIYVDTGGVEILCGRRVSTQNIHDTGCTLSSAIASLRLRRTTWLEAVRDAKDYLTGAIAHAEALDVGHGRGPVHHFY